jgi:transposase
MLQCETHSKDHRPDLKQLVWILTVTADGAVPIAFRVADGNTADVTTHIDTWDALVALTGEVDFLYVADSKLATFDNVAHIHTRGGTVPVGAARLPQGGPASSGTGS